jgi:hypothetical protein
MSNTDKIVKATKNLIQTINGQSEGPLDEFQAIQHLKDLIIGAA